MTLPRWTKIKMVSNFGVAFGPGGCPSARPAAALDQSWRDQLENKTKMANIRTTEKIWERGSELNV